VKEFEIIDKYFKPLSSSSKQVSQLLCDDVAKIQLKKNSTLIVSKDSIVENVHFLSNENPANIAAKLLLSNLSDLASSGAKPLYYLLGFTKNEKTDCFFLEKFCKELKKIQKKFKISLIGGDTFFSKNLVFSATIFGEVSGNKILSRNAAKKGELIFVSGFIGDAYLGLQLKLDKLKISNNSLRKYFLTKHSKPIPKILLGQKLLEKKLSSCAIDVSDGLFADLHQICKSSKAKIKIYQNKIPISIQAKKILKQSNFTSHDLFSGGEDYELIFTAKKKDKTKISLLAKTLDLQISCIGEIIDSPTKPSICLVGENKEEITIKKFGYEH
jgi:thiamine-monophosphate kinase